METTIAGALPGGTGVASAGAADAGVPRIVENRDFEDTGHGLRVFGGLIGIGCNWKSLEFRGFEK
ncbi:hypothetical protein [Bifidobacterium goeldii]|uniref:hypothetical protein n=1 Tax=Bifidobacterium goeldii TaxID=2306975 RepID=UPI000F7ECE5B|nr:hypothetical protein [Bifidobacterium goeldii]